MRRYVLLLVCLLPFAGCELVNALLGEWGGHNRAVDRALESPNESIQQEAAEVRDHADRCAQVPMFPSK